MEQTEKQQVAEARKVLDGILQNVPLLKIAWDRTPAETPEIEALADLKFELTHDNRVYSVAAEFKAYGFPQQLRQAIDQLLRYRHKVHRQDELMVVAPYISPEGAAVCREDKVSYFDLAGNCRIAMGLLYIERSGFPNPFEKNALAAPSLYGMRGERILRILLNDPKQPWKVTPLVEKAGVSAGTVSTIRKLLIARDWAKETPDGLLLTDPQKLLRDWAAVWGRRAFKPFACFSRLTPEETEKKLAEFAKKEKRKLALTGAAAAWRYAPMTRYQRTQVYWEGEPEELVQALELRKTDTGANVHILAPRDRGVFDFLETINGVPVVCPIQTFLDLQRDPARGEEAAEQLWQTKLFHG